MSRLRKLGRMIWRLLLVLLAVALVCLILIQLPPVQSYLTGRLERFLQNKLQTEVRIDAIRLRLPQSLALRGVYLEDPQRDTVLNVRELAVGFRLGKLLQKQIRLSKLTLEGGTLYLRTDADGLRNYAFIAEAFTSPSDTSASIHKTEPAPAAWTFFVDRAGLSLRDIHMQYVDAPSQTEITVSLQRLDAGIPFVDIQNNRYQIAAIDAEGIDGKVILGRIDTVAAEEKVQSASYVIEAASINLERTGFFLQLGAIRLGGHWEALRSGPANFQLRNEAVDLTLPSLVLEGGRFQYDDTAKKASLNGFDPRHFNFQELAFDVEETSYRDGALQARINRLSGRDEDAFVLQELRTRIEYAPEKIALADLELRTDRSNINVRQSGIDFGVGGSNTSPGNWRVNADWDIARLGLADLLYFYPDLEKIPFFRTTTPALYSQGSVSGTLDDFSISRVMVKNRDIRVEVAGRVTKMTEPALLGLDLQIRQLSSTRPGMVAWLPPGSLPEYLQLPDQTSLQGSVRGKLRDLRVNLRGSTRRGPLPLVSHLAATARLQEVSDLDQFRFDVQLDSCYLTRTDLLAYLPPDLLPQGMSLPQAFVLEGLAGGQLTSFSTDLRLRTFRGANTTYLAVAGQLDSILAPSALRADLQLDIRGLDRTELTALLPAAWLPDSMRWPDLSRLSGRLRGGMDSLAADLRFSTNLGAGQLTGTLVERQQYDLLFELTPFQPALLYEPKYLDSLLGFAFAPLAIRLDLTGKGFDRSNKTRGDLQLNIWKEGSDMSSGLVLKAKLADQLLQAGLQTHEAGLEIDSELAIAYGTPATQTDFALQLQELDLRQLRITETPIRLSGSIDARATGSTPDTLSGRLLAREWSMRYDSAYQTVDSLLLTARMDNGDNQFNLTSDLMNAQLIGTFRFSRALEALRQQLSHYWDAQAVDSLVGRTPDRFELSMEVCRTEVLTMGFVPGLQELTPAEWTMRYDNREAQLSTNFSLGHLRWADIQLDTMQFKATAAADNFEYRLDIRNVDVRQVARVPVMQWEGLYEKDRLTAVFTALDRKEKPRFELKTQFRRLDANAYELQLAPRQLLDYQWWRMSADNAITLRDDVVEARDWRLFRNREAIEIREVSKDRFRVLFEHFDLDLVANILDQQDPYLGGVIHGEVSLAHPLRTPEIGADLRIDSLSLFAAALGNLSVNGRTDKKKLETQLQLQGEGNDLAFEGSYEWQNTQNGLDFQLDLNRIDLAALEPLTFGNLEKLRGALKGQIHIAGSVQKPVLEGAVHFDSTSFDVTLLQTRVRLGNQPLVFDRSGLTFRDLEIFDAEGHRGVLSNGLRTEDYRSFVLHTDLRAENFQVLNTTSADNDLYYGKLVVDASALLRGRLSEPDIEVFARPRRGSNLTYVYRSGTPQVASWEGVVEFVSAEDTTVAYADQQLVEISRELNLRVSVRMEITEDLTFKAITNPLTNDYFEGRAKGSLNYQLFPDGRMDLTGGLEMVEGRYLFTYQEVVRRTFSVAGGSTIRWMGDPLNPELNIRVLYQVETSPFPLIAQSEGDERGANRKETFQVVLTISGSPSETDIETSIVYPEIPVNSNSPEIQAAVQRINRDPSQQNTQAFALILFNGFLGTGARQTDFQVSDLDLESNIGNLITRQLNNLANRYIKFVELDIDLENYERRGGGFEDTQADFRVSLRKQFLNDRLSISLDGVASAQTDQQSTNTTYMLDNLTFEYDLTPDGRFRIKVYNRRDYDDIITGNSLKVGGALVFSRDFNEIKLFGKKK